MIAVALKGLAGRKVRALLTAFAVVIGVSMVSGTYVLTDTMQKAFDGIFTASYDDTDAVIAGKQIVESSSSGNAPGARLAAGEGPGAAPGRRGRRHDRRGRLVRGRDHRPRRQGAQLRRRAAARPRLRRRAPPVQPAEAAVGRLAAGPGQVVVDAGTAEEENYKAGDSVVVSTFGEQRRYQVTGVATFGDVDSLGGATMAVFDLRTAQKVLHKEGVYDGISITAKEGTSPAELVEAVQPLVPASLEVNDSEKQADEQAAETDEGLSFIRYFLLGFGGIALFVGAFVIFNTLSITVAQRTREYATLRTLGASRRQVMRSVVDRGHRHRAAGLGHRAVPRRRHRQGHERAVQGDGHRPAGVRHRARRAHDRPVARAGHRDHAASPASCPRGGRRASRRSPRSARARRCPPSRFAPHSIKAAVGVVVAAVAAISAGVFVSGLSGARCALLLGGGVLALFLGVALAAPHLVKPLARARGLAGPARGWRGRRAGRRELHRATPAAPRRPRPRS